MHGRAALLLFGLGTAAFAQSQIAVVSFVSEPGDWIGQGQTRTLTYEPGMPGSAFQLTVLKTTPSGLPSLAYFTLGGPFSGGNTNTNVTFWIGTDMLGHELAPGFYPDFRRAVLHQLDIPVSILGFKIGAVMRRSVTTPSTPFTLSPTEREG